MTWYLTIRSDVRHSEYTSTASLVDFLSAIPELRHTGPVEFQAAEGQPWVAVVMADCDFQGNYASDGRFLPEVNVVVLVCSHASDQAWYDALAGRIATFLGWSAVEEGENRQVWPPAEQRDGESLREG